MEIECKFRIPNEEIFQQLLSTPTVAGYTLGAASHSEMRDSYLDTQDGALRAAGFACRLRWEAGRLVATMKGLGEARGAVHRRAEYEVELPEPLPPDAWPPSEARDLALQFCGEHPLAVLFYINQTRYTRQVWESGRHVADMDVAQVQSSSGPADRAGWTGLELEVELAPGGTEADLKLIAGSLEHDWELEPETQSKFHRALLFAGADPASDAEAEPLDSPHLTPEERRLIAGLADERAVISRRARLLLAWDEGLSIAGMLERSGLSERRARYWRWAFRAQRLGIFPGRALRAVRARSAAELPPEPGAARQEQAPEAPTAGATPKKIPAEVELPKRPGVEPDDPMSEAGRKVLRFHFARMLYNEPGTRQGKDIEALHDMRVATRRLRAAFRVFEEHLDASSTAPLVKGLRRTGTALGAVRDLDVFREKVQTYVSSLPQPQRAGLGGFLMELEAQREAARQRLLAYLDSQKYRSFVERTREFIESPRIESQQNSGASGPRPRFVRHVAPMTLYERLAAGRAYDPWVSIPDPSVTQLHALRIATKRLRYALEFFQEVLGPEAKGLIRDAVAVQDHLGAVQDGVIASGILRDFLVWGTWGPEVEGRRLRGDVVPVIAPGVAIYLAVQQQEIQQLIASFPQVWQRVMGVQFSRSLAAAVGVL